MKNNSVNRLASMPNPETTYFVKHRLDCLVKEKGHQQECIVGKNGNYNPSNALSKGDRKVFAKRKETREHPLDSLL